MERKRPWIHLILLIVKFSEVFTQFVESPAGPIKGTTVYYDNSPVEAYLGIPYAKPPIGDLRFSRPVPVDSFSETKDASKFGAGCLQHSKLPFPWLDDMPGLSEDCLFLNIWVPVGGKDSEKKAVLFYIHGGGWRIGSSRLDFYDGRTLAKEGDVIVVTINYRLGPLGFFDLGINGAAGNMGLYDILEALKWVNRNIESFGGDRNQITLFGWSVGAIAAGLFCISPLAQGLFRRAVLSSLSPASMDSEDNNRDYEICQGIAEVVGCLPSNSTDKETVLKCLKGVDGMEITTAISKVYDDSKSGLQAKYGDEILPSNPRQAVVNGDFRAVELLIGANNGDGSSVLTRTMTELFGFYGEKVPQINKTYAESIIRQQFKDFEDPDAVVQHYVENVPEDDYKDIRFKLADAVGDYARICPAVYFAEASAKKLDNTYFYFFTHQTESDSWSRWMRAVHFTDIPYFFGYPLRHPDKFTPAEQNLSRDLVQFLTRFAKYGKPSENWISFSKSRHVFKYMDTIPKGFGIGPNLMNCDFFRPYFGF